MCSDNVHGCIPYGMNMRAVQADMGYEALQLLGYSMLAEVLGSDRSLMEGNQNTCHVALALNGLQLIRHKASSQDGMCGRCIIWMHSMHAWLVYS